MNYFLLVFHFVLLALHFVKQILAKDLSLNRHLVQCCSRNKYRHTFLLLPLPSYSGKVRSFQFHFAYFRLTYFHFPYINCPTIHDSNTFGVMVVERYSLSPTVLNSLYLVVLSKPSEAIIALCKPKQICLTLRPS